MTKYLSKSLPAAMRVPLKALEWFMISMLYTKSLEIPPQLFCSTARDFSYTFAQVVFPRGDTFGFILGYSHQRRLPGSNAAHSEYLRPWSGSWLEGIFLSLVWREAMVSILILIATNAAKLKPIDHLSNANTELLGMWFRESTNIL
jgi:hypothetical protein